MPQYLKCQHDGVLRNGLRGISRNMTAFHSIAHNRAVINVIAARRAACQIFHTRRGQDFCDWLIYDTVCQQNQRVTVLYIPCGFFAEGYCFKLKGKAISDLCFLICAHLICLNAVNSYMHSLFALLKRINGGTTHS